VAARVYEAARRRPGAPGREPPLPGRAALRVAPPPRAWPEAERGAARPVPPRPAGGRPGSQEERRRSPSARH